MTVDPREATIRNALTRAASMDEFVSGRNYDVAQERANFDALASLARDARKATLAEAVVEAAEPFAKAGKRLIHEGNRGYRDGTFDNLYESYRFRIGDVLAIYNALAAFRAEFPADPQEKP